MHLKLEMAYTVQCFSIICFVHLWFLCSTRFCFFENFIGKLGKIEENMPPPPFFEEKGSFLNNFFMHYQHLAAEASCCARLRETSKGQWV